MNAGFSGGSPRKEPKRWVFNDSLIPGRPFEYVHEMLLDRLGRGGASLECLRLLALNCVAGRRMELAERFLERIRELTIAEADEFEYLNTLGRIYRGLEKLEEAMEWYRRALERTTTDELVVYRVHCHLANCLRRLGRNGESEEACRVAIASHPDRCEAYVELGECLRGQGRLFEAGKVFMTAMGKDPYDAMPWLRLDDLVINHPELREQLVYCDRPIPAGAKTLFSGPWML